jgi:hypothetical protein
VRVFLDNCLAPRHAQALQVLLPEHEIVHLRARFGADTSDEEWLRQLGAEEGWIVISGDSRIHRSKHLARAWRASRLTVFFLRPAWMKVPLLEQHARLARAMPRILELAEQHPRDAGFGVGINGKTERL